MTDSPTPSLRDRVLASSKRIVGAPERNQMLRLLGEADAYRLHDAASASLSTTLARSPQNVERNLDMIRIPSNGIWVEYADAPRRPAGVVPLGGLRHPHEVGMLVCPDPGDGDKVVMFSAWDFEPAAGVDAGRGSVRHSYAVAAFSREDVSHHAFEARHRYAGQEADALARILSLVHAYVPEGLSEELLLTSDLPRHDPAAREALEDSVMRDVTSEAPFALAALMLLSSAGAPVTAPADGGIGLVGIPATGRFSRLRTALLGDGFVRKGPPRAPRLSYMPPSARASEA